MGRGISAQEPEETEGVPTREAGVENADHSETSVRETWVSKKKSSSINDLVFIKASYSTFFGAGLSVSGARAKLKSTLFLMLAY